MSQNDVIHVALAFSDPKGTYARHAAVTAASVYENARARRVSVHVLHDETLTPVNRSALEELARKYGQDVAFHDAGERYRKLNPKVENLGLQGLLGTMYRLLIPDLIDAEKTIYLDCDIVVDMDIAELWSQDLKGRAVGAVGDFFPLNSAGKPKISWSRKKVCSLWGIEPENYFNAGVLLLDLNKIRARYHLLEKLVYFFEEYGALAVNKDQDFLNWLFVGDAAILDERFNRTHPSGESESSVRGAILHMYCEHKPWNSYTRPYADDLYWRYLRLTPYCASTDGLIRAVLRGIGSSRLMHRHSTDCLKRLGKQLKENIFRPYLSAVPLILWKSAKRRFLPGRSRGQSGGARAGTE